MCWGFVFQGRKPSAAPPPFRATPEPVPDKTDRILYVQYYNPAAYPPLEHSSHVLAGAGWSVRFLGARLGVVGALELPPHPRIEVRELPEAAPGWRQKLNYLRFCLWVVANVLAWRPRWVYASDVMAAPPALAAMLLGARVVYHEHDSPNPTGGEGLFLRLCLAARRRLARTADALVLPNAERAEHVSRAVAGGRSATIVWNCPLREEVRSARAPLDPDGPVRVLYHGSIVPERLPLSVLHAVAAASDRTELVVAGYVPPGAEGHVEAMRAEAERLGIGHRFTYAGPVPRRKDLLDLCATCDVGLALMPLRSGDVNLRAMTGASNKAFDYLACGLALVVSDLPDWRAMFVDAGFAVACDPRDEGSIERALREYAADPARLREMGERGRRRVAAEWNYEARFAPVLDLLSRPGAPVVSAASLPAVGR